MRKRTGARRSGARGVSPASGKITSSCPSMPTVGGVGLEESTVSELGWSESCPNKVAGQADASTTVQRQTRAALIAFPSQSFRFAEVTPEPWQKTVGKWAAQD